MTLTIEITSDFICPWCFVAEARLKKAIAQLAPNVDLNIVWYPFELNPNMPTAGIDRKLYRTTKFGSWAYSQQLDAQTVQATQADDLDFRYDLMEITPNTLQSHRLTGFAAQHNKATAMVERIFKAYFTEGQNISDAAVLTHLASDIGLDSDEVSTFLNSDAGTQTIRDLEQQHIAQGIQGVPHIRIGEQVLTGAQPFERFLTTLHSEIQKLTH